MLMHPRVWPGTLGRIHFAASGFGLSTEHVFWHTAVLTDHEFVRTSKGSGAIVKLEGGDEDSDTNKTLSQVRMQGGVPHK